MPVAVGIAIRYIIMAAVQLGLWTLLEKYGIPLLNSAIAGIMQTFGVSEEDAKAFMANKILIAFEEVGIFAVSLRTKLPIKVAELLGFTSKGFVARKLSQVAEVKLGQTAISATAIEVSTTAEVAKVVEAVAQGRGLSVSTVGSLFSSLINMIGKISIPLILAANVMDFGNWQGAYQRTFQKIFTTLGFPPDSPMPKAKTISPATWTRIYSTIEVLNPIGINFPFSDADKPYSRGNLAELIDEISANLVKNGTQATYKNVIGLALPMVQLKGQPDLTKLDNLKFSDSAVAPADASKGGTTTQTTKVFTGIVSQGVVGQGLVFTPRPDDLIENLAELRTAAANNLASYLNTVLGKIVYEVKVVSSIVTKDGFKQTGTAQKIQTGTFTNGTPKYKTVINKFAVAYVYAITDKGTRSKLTTIVLGPVDSAKLQVGVNDLREIETQLPKEITTNDISEIKEINTKSDVVVVKKETELQSNYWNKLGISDERWFSDEFDQASKDANLDTYNRYVKGNIPFNNALPIKTSSVENTPVPATINSATQAKATTSKVGANASTLYEWYQAQGQTLPSVSARSVTYEGLGLGPRSYYTGTSEQNTRLLDYLKGSKNTVDDMGNKVTVFFTVDDMGKATNATFYKKQDGYYQLLPNGEFLKVTDQRLINDIAAVRN